MLPEEEAHSDLASFQPTDSDVPSFLEDCNRVTIPFLKPVKLLLTSPYSGESISTHFSYSLRILTGSSVLCFLNQQEIIYCFHLNFFDR